MLYRQISDTRLFGEILIFNRFWWPVERIDFDVWNIFRVNLESLGGGKLMERAKFIISEIQENFENYSDKKDATLEVKKFD